ncbi:MAG: hypothetical protein KDA68_12705 [Planctomycetaceae bacterium]|nr:hypothetical protein [Planctomycetaceae bacterium]
MSPFADIACEVFKFLETEYGFSVEKCTESNGSSHVLYKNTDNGVAVKITYEFSSAFVFIFVYRLVHGELRENSQPISDDSEIFCIDFNDVIPANHKMKPAYECQEDSLFFDEQNGLRNYVSEFSARLKRFGGPVLRGDFTEFAQAEKIIRQRARKLRE